MAKGWTPPAPDYCKFCGGTKGLDTRNRNVISCRDCRKARKRYYKKRDRMEIMGAILIVVVFIVSIPLFPLAFFLYGKFKESHPTVSKSALRGAILGAVMGAITVYDKLQLGMLF